jgi:hypothetical protein
MFLQKLSSKKVQIVLMSLSGVLIACIVIVLYMVLRQQYGQMVQTPPEILSPEVVSESPAVETVVVRSEAELYALLTAPYVEEEGGTTTAVVDTTDRDSLLTKAIEGDEAIEVTSTSSVREEEASLLLLETPYVE